MNLTTAQRLELIQAAKLTYVTYREIAHDERNSEETREEYHRRMTTVIAAHSELLLDTAQGLADSLKEPEPELDYTEHVPVEELHVLMGREVVLTLHDGERISGTLVFDPRAGDYENTVMVRRVVPRELIAAAAITEDDEPPAETRTP